MSVRKTTETFVEQAQTKFGHQFDYFRTVYVKNDSKVTIRCVAHDLEFRQTPSNHLSFNGCPKCLEEEQRQRFQKTAEDFIRSAKIRHGDKYDYSRVSYVNNHTKVAVGCPKHGWYEVTPINHLKAAGVDCQKCGFEKLPGGYFNKFFQRHPELADKPSTLYFVRFQDPNDYIFYKLGITTQNIETRFAAPAYQGFVITPIWESSGPLILIYTLEKHLKRIFQSERFRVQYANFAGSTECFKECIPHCMIADDVSMDRDLELVSSRILEKSGIYEHKFHARKLAVTQLSSSDANEFFDQNHTQGGSDQGTIAFGLYHDSELICAMSFGKPRFTKDHEYELIRLATKKFCKVAGGASRLFSAFVKEHHPQSIISYSDKQWNIGNIYSILGFVKQNETTPNYCYVKEGISLSRMKCQKHKLQKLLGETFNPAESESENMFRNGYRKQFNRGNDVFSWSKL